jgi:MYXO-CTERM domain-containing protein
MNGWDGLTPGGTLPTSSPQHGWYFTCPVADAGGAEISSLCTTYGEPDCRFMDLRNTLTHEVGHLVGLAHVPDSQPAATMFARTTPGEIEKRSLSEDDIAGVCAIYPDEGDGGCGCGSGGAAGALALLLAALALHRRGPHGAR